MLEQVLGWATDGGPIVWLLAVGSVYSLALIVLKFVDLSGVLAGVSVRAQAIRDWEEGRRDAAQKALARKTPADRVLGHAMAGLEAKADRAPLERELERRGNDELERMRRHLRTLEVIAMVSPLLGLLGTVLGMIQSFQELELAGGSANAAVLAGGIWQALLTTAAGLIVAIPAAIAANLFSARVDRAGHQIEDAVSALFAADHAQTDG
ncbi:MAG: MotA/TolQ/ExbB proton channel family protein [Pseudomonadota bacterium]